MACVFYTLYCGHFLRQSVCNMTPKLKLCATSALSFFGGVFWGLVLIVRPFAPTVVVVAAFRPQVYGQSFLCAATSALGLAVFSPFFRFSLRCPAAQPTPCNVPVHLVAMRACLGR